MKKLFLLFLIILNLNFVDTYCVKSGQEEVQTMIELPGHNTEELITQLKNLKEIHEKALEKFQSIWKRKLSLNTRDVLREVIGNIDSAVIDLNKYINKLVL